MNEDEVKHGLFYDLDGIPIDAKQANQLMRDFESRLVAETQLETIHGILWLATVHMVMDQADDLFTEHVPVLYATRIHGVTHRRGLTGMRGKYQTRQAAFAGHMAVLHDLVRDLGGELLSMWQKPIKRVA